MDDIDIDGHHRRALKHGRQRADQDKVDLVVEKHAQNLAEISLN